MTVKFVIDVNLSNKPEKGFLADFFDDIQKREGLVIVVGGTKYGDELSRYPSLLRQINNLKRAGQNHKIDERDSSTIDHLAEELRGTVVQKVGFCPEPCDDFHIFSLVNDSGAQCVLTGDKRMRLCIKTIRPKVGAKKCPNPKMVRTEEEYRGLRARSFVI